MEENAFTLSGDGKKRCLTFFGKGLSSLCCLLDHLEKGVKEAELGTVGMGV